MTTPSVGQNQWPMTIQLGPDPRQSSGALRSALEIGRLAEERESEQSQAHGVRGGARVLRVVDEPRHIGAERPVVGAVLEQVEDGHCAMAVPAARIQPRRVSP